MYIVDFPERRAFICPLLASLRMQYTDNPVSFAASFILSIFILLSPFEHELFIQMFVKPPASLFIYGAKQKKFPKTTIHNL
jgi:hypothetical protein